MKYLEELENKVFQIIAKNKDLTLQFEALKQENDHLKEQNQQFEASLMKECSLSQTLASEKAVIKDTIKELLSSINSLETSR